MCSAHHMLYLSPAASLTFVSSLVTMDILRSIVIDEFNQIDALFNAHLRIGD